MISSRARWLYTLLLLPFLLYLATMSHHVGSADTFEFQVTAPQLGIAHPTGYPLYLLLGKIWSLLPLSSTAWRLNFSSAVYALIASGIVALTAQQLTKNHALAVGCALLLATRPIWWSQAIVAEVYQLNAVVVATTLLLALWQLRHPQTRLWIALAVVIGLGLTHHLTTLLLFPLLLFVAIFSWPTLIHALPRALLAFLLPLSLWAYLPLRWQAVNGEAMGFGRFLGWITGSRFSGALQWGLWLNDSGRYAILGRFFRETWGILPLLIALLPFIYLFWRPHLRRPICALLLFIAGYSFYCLNYNVPDLAVFLLPAHIGIALLIAVGGQLLWEHPRTRPIFALIAVAITLSALWQLPQNYTKLDQSAPNPLTAWGQATLALPLAPNGAILADSDKFPPLYYWQQAEGVRPDLHIAVLPDEAAYRAELDQRLQAGQTVYLARYLPRLPYAMRAMGPLVQLLPQAEQAPISPPLWQEANVGLISAELWPTNPFDPKTVAVALRWQSLADQHPTWQLYWRWDDDRPILSQHPVHNFYPLFLWRAGEVVDDFAFIPYPLRATAQSAELQLAIGPAFTPAEQLIWHAVGTMALPASDPDKIALATRMAANRPNLPEGASNFADKIALLALTPSAEPLSAGQPWEVTMQWQALAPLDEAYTVFVQLLDSADTIIAQDDSWPVQGTFPTDEWRVGEVVTDRHTLSLPAQLPTGQYRLVVGWYLLRDLRRLPIVSADGQAVGDFYEFSNLIVPP